MSKYGTFLNQKRLTKNEYYEYKKQNKKYTDDLYPPNNTSIYSQTPSGEFRDKKAGPKLKDSLDSLLKKDDKTYTIEWERISDRPYFNKIYNEKISHEQIEQGSLGDCYLISLMASISHFPELIIGKKDIDTPHILYNYEYWDIGYYEIMFFIDGEFKIVIIDDYIPFVKEKGITIFANSSENYFWVNLVEKAYSKICGGYTSLDLIGKSYNKNKEIYDHFQIMTGFKNKKYPFYEEKDGQFILHKSKADNVIKIIEENLSDKNKKKFNTMITAGTPDENKGLYLEENYIPYQHSFSILDFKKIKINNGKNEMRLMLLNNPWGRNIYNEGIGPYCMDNMNESVINLKPYIEYNLNSEDGCFWIDYETFLKNYISITVCKIPYNYNCINYSLNESKNYELPLLFKLKIEKKTNIWFNVNMNISELVINGNDSMCLVKFLIVGGVDEKGKIVKTYHELVGLDDLQVNYNLDEGNYIIWLYIPKRYFPQSNKLNAHFMISSEQKPKIKFLDYDTDFIYIKNLSQYLFDQKNEQKMKEKDDKMIKCIVDYQGLDGILIAYLANNTTDKKIICEPESECTGFSPINYNENIDLKKINVTLLPGESKYFIGISILQKSMFAIEKINMTYSETKEKKPNLKIMNFSEFLNKKVNESKKINSVHYITNSYCYIRTNFNKNPDKRDEDKIYNYFLSLMTEKLKPKKLSQEKINMIAKNTWDKMKKEEKEKIIKRYEQKKKELKNNVLKLQVLKYIKRNSVNTNNDNNKLNKMDNDIINMKVKTRLSQQFQFAKFEDDLDDLETRIKNILPKIKYLKSTEKEEIELDKYIDKQNEISSELKKLLSEKITRENGERIEKRKIELLKEYEPIYKKMCEYFKKHDENMKLYNDINKEGAQLLKEVEGQIDVYNTKKLNMKKEVNNLIDQFTNFMKEIQKLKLVEINEKCNREVKKAKDFAEDVKKMQNKLISFVDELKEDIKKQQNEIFSQDIFDNIHKKQNELSDTLLKLKDTEKDFNYLIKLIEEENTFIKNCEKLDKNISQKKDDPKVILNNITSYEKQIKQLAEKINKFQKDIQQIVGLFNGYIKETNDIRIQVSEAFEKFKEKKIPVSENLEKVVKKINELDQGFKELKVKELIEKNKNELLANWQKVNDAFNNTCNKIKSGGKEEKKSNNNSKENKISKEKVKEIKDKVKKEMEIIEKEQNDITNKLDKIKKDKYKLVEDINNMSKEEQNLLSNIRNIFNNDIKNITLQNVKTNFEKYNKFNEKTRELGPKINPLAQRCKSLFEEFNSFVKVENTNRKKIYEQAHNLQDNGIGIDEKMEKMLKKAKEVFDELDKLYLNELNDLFNNNVVGKFKEMQNIIEAISNVTKK